MPYSGSLAAQTDMAAYEQITAAAEHTALLYASKPYHLRLQVTVIGTKGKADQDVSIERWQNGDDSRTVFTTGPVTDTRLEHSGKTYHLEQGGTTPDLAEAVLETVLHPGPYPSELAGTLPEHRKQAFGKQQLDCVMLDIPMKRLTFAPLGLFPTYCFTDQSLVVRFNVGSQTFLQAARGRFLEHEVNTGVTLMEGSQVVARGKVTTLSTFEPKSDEFEPTPELALAAIAAKIPGEVMAGRALKRVNPIYPESAKQSRTTGTVVLTAVLGQDGTVQTLRPLSAPDPDLALAAVAAVRQWTYQPYILNGQPTDVTTTITVNFNLR